MIDLKTSYSVLFLTVFVNFLCPTNLWAKNTIAVVKSSSLKAYELPISSFIESLDLEVNSVSIFDIQGDKKIGLKVVDEIKAKKPKLIFALGVKSAWLMAKKFPETPVVFAVVMNWWRYKALRAKNVCGISLDVPEESLFTQFKMVVKKAKSLGIVYNKSTSSRRVRRANIKLKKLRFEPLMSELAKNGDIRSAIEALPAKLDGLWAVPDSSLYTKENFDYLLGESFRKNIPLITYSENFVRAGAFFSVSVNYGAIGAQAADFANQILEEMASPEDLRVAPPIGSTLVINLKTAKKIGVEISPFMLKTADILVGEED